MAPHDGIPEEDADSLEDSTHLSRISLRKDTNHHRHQAEEIAAPEEDPVSTQRKRMLFLACVCILGGNITKHNDDRFMHKACKQTIGVAGCQAAERAREKVCLATANDSKNGVNLVSRLIF